MQYVNIRKSQLANGWIVLPSAAAGLKKNKNKKNHTGLLGTASSNKKASPAVEILSKHRLQTLTASLILLSQMWSSLQSDFRTIAFSLCNRPETAEQAAGET